MVKYNHLSVADVLDLTVDEALVLFKNHPAIRRSLETLADVGLGYIALGQSSPTLSGGEAQRVKLSRELSKRSTGRTLYILDEPTTGLHFDDIKKLLRVLDRLVEGGNTVVVIEHNLDVIKTADWVIDMGPEGGDAGGKVVAEGTRSRWPRFARATRVVFWLRCCHIPAPAVEPADPAHAPRVDGPAIALSGRAGPPTGFRSRRGSGRPPAVSGSSGFRSAWPDRQRRVAGGGGRPWDAA